MHERYDLLKKFIWYTILLIIMPVAGIVKRCINSNCRERLKSGYLRATRLHRAYIKTTKYGKTEWKPIGWYCPVCKMLYDDNNQK